MDQTPPKGKEEYQKYLQSDEWKEIRLRELARADYRCERCGSGKNLEVHHVRYDPPVYIVLCDSCHREVHRHDNRAKDYNYGWGTIYKEILPEQYDKEFGHRGSGALNWDTIERNLVKMLGTTKVWFSLKPFQDYLSEMQNKDIRKIVSEGETSLYEIKRRTGYSDRKIKKVLHAMKENTNEED